jgi:uncharacterized protein YfaS (alpha-2-macroglobulin family)
MIKRFGFLAGLFAVLMVASFRAEAALELPVISEVALAYRQSIEKLPTQSTVVQLLTSIREAENKGNAAEICRLYERLVAVDLTNFRSWLKLSLAWREADKTSDKALSATYNAYQVARRAPDQVEALLVMTSILRARLDVHRKDYDTARADADKAQVALDLAGESSSTRCRGDSTDLTSNVTLLCKTRQTAITEAQQASTRIADIALALDNLYGEIELQMPSSGLTAEKMKSTDNRSTVFAPVIPPGKDQPDVSFKIESGETRACIRFSQDLKANNPSYRDKIKVSRVITAAEGTTEEEPVTNFTAEALERTICLSGLTAGSQYNFALLEGLPSKSGAKLTSDTVIKEVQFPDPPAQVVFSGRQYILPRSGFGEVPLKVTNVEVFDLELFRITDRALHRHIALEHIGGDMPFDEYKNLKDHFGERMWLGTVQMPTAPHGKDEAVKVYLPVRELLKKRREWLKGEVVSNLGHHSELSSGRQMLIARSDNNAGVQGEFFASAPDFEAAALNLVTPGVYALVTRDLGDLKECKEDCEKKYLVQWFIDTDIGLTFYEGDEKFTVVARSLQSGAAKPKAKVELVTAGNRVLATGSTEPDGTVTFDRSLTRGTQSNALAAIMVEDGNDFGFLTFGPERLDLSRLNVDGRPLPHGLNAFLTTDRGVYQPGDKIELLALVRDVQGLAPDTIAGAIVRAEARDRTLVQRPITPQEWKLGGAKIQLSLPENTRPGGVRVTLSIGAGLNATVGETVIQVGSIRPDRVAVNLNERDWTARVTVGGLLEVNGKANGRYLAAADSEKWGAAGNLKAEATIRISPAETPEQGCYGEFAFGRFEDDAPGAASEPLVRFTDRDGNLDLQMPGVSMPVSTKPLSATVEVTLFDSSGPVGSRSLTLPVHDSKGWIGINKTPRMRGANGLKLDLDLEVVRFTADNQPEGDHTLLIELKRERDQYTWERRDDIWQHKRTSTVETVARRSVSTSELKMTGPSSSTERRDCVPGGLLKDFARDVDVGRYVLIVSDEQTGRVSSVRFQAGAAGTDADQLEPNLFVLSSTQRTYRPNETIEIVANVPFDGQVLVGFAQGDIQLWKQAEAKGGIAKLQLAAPAEWAGKGVYALATVFRSGADETNNVGPNRAIGATYFEINGSQAGYTASIGMLDQASQGFIAPDDDLSFRVCLRLTSLQCSKGDRASLTGLPSEAFAVAYVVDDGLLSLTGHRNLASDPQHHFYGRQRLGVRIMDNYSRLLLKTGGDRPSRLALSNYTSDRIVARAEGPVQLRDGRADFTFKGLGLSNGKLSVFVIVWSKDFVTTAPDSVRVRSSIIADLSVPAFLLAGDRAIIPLLLQNASVLAGEFVVHITAAGAPAGVTMVAEANQGVATRQTEMRTSLAVDEIKTGYVTVDIPSESRGEVKLRVDLEAVGSSISLKGHKREWSFNVLAPRLTTVETVSFPVDSKGTNVTKLIEGLVTENYEPKSVVVRARFADRPPPLLAATAPDWRQGGGRILHHLVLQGLTLVREGSANVDPTRKRELIRILDEIQSLQLPDGSFIPYRTVGDPNLTELNFVPESGTLQRRLFRTATVLDLLLQARTAGYEVSDTSVKAARTFVNAQLNDARELEKQNGCSLGFDELYATLVLVDSGGIGSDRIEEIAACKYDDAAAQAAAAAVMARFGRSDEAKVILSAFQVDQTSYDALRTFGEMKLAMMLTFLTEANAPPKLLDPVAKFLLGDKKRSVSRVAMAWLARAPNFDVRSKLEVSDLRIAGSALGTLRYGRNGVLETADVPFGLFKEPVMVAALNKSARGFITVEGLLTNAGEARQLPSRAIKRRVFKYPNGQEIDLKTEPLNLGDYLAVVIEGGQDGLSELLASDVSANGDEGEPLVIADLLPSAFKVVSGDVLGRKGVRLSGALGQLQAQGSLRSVDTEPDRWVALVVPVSRLDTESAKLPNDQPAQQISPGNRTEFRQGYLVRVNMAGHFTLPGTAIEATTTLAPTLRTEESVIEVKRPQ